MEVFENILKDCNALITELTTIITPNKYKMTDDERLKRIDGIYSNMQENYSFAQSVSTETRLLAVQRMKEENDVQSSRALNGIKNR